MFPILYALALFVADVFKSRRRLEADNLFLRRHLNIGLVGVVQVVRPALASDGLLCAAMPRCASRLMVSSVIGVSAWPDHADVPPWREGCEVNIREVLPPLSICAREPRQAGGIARFLRRYSLAAHQTA
jgi:hypothetical protein